ncbi:MAG: FAD binding domain-containing protein, partial [Bacteroidales bacterium]|nr:FAD binding domain-containing protein [Bacteroidales bacterium]
MNKFSWYDAASLDAAQKEVNATVSETLQPGAADDAVVYKAAGIDLLDLMKEGLSRPSKLVGIKNLPGLDKLAFDSEAGMMLGANLTLARMAENSAIKENYTALHQAASQTATPHVRNMATLGGNLAQRTRCWYFRAIEHHCFRKGSTTCFAHTGENENHAILGYGYCVSVH